MLEEDSGHTLRVGNSGERAHLRDVAGNRYACGWPADAYAQPGEVASAAQSLVDAAHAVVPACPAFCAQPHGSHRRV